MILFTTAIYAYRGGSGHSFSSQHGPIYMQYFHFALASSALHRTYDAMLILDLMRSDDSTQNAYTIKQSGEKKWERVRSLRVSMISVHFLCALTIAIFQIDG